MESNSQETSKDVPLSAQHTVTSSMGETLMAKESGTLQHPMSTCALEKLAVNPMNEAKDLPPSSSMVGMEEGSPIKRLKVEGGELPSKLMSPPSSPKPSVHIEVAPSVSIEVSKQKPVTSSSSDVTAPHATTTSISEGSSELSLDSKHAASSRPGSNTHLPTTTEPAKSAARISSVLSEAPKKNPLHHSSKSSPLDSGTLPIKSLTMMHLHKKYTAELEYMLREFRKLERQLLGAKGNGVEENAGSRERREKLHSFILHLENTLEQIQLGVRLEAEGKSTVMVGVAVGDVGGEVTAPTEEEVKRQLADSGALASLTKEKEEEENVQKLEEHILANLLPVKVRLKKQLAAQQGASRNPVGMPVARRGMIASASAEKGTGTFAAAAEKKRQQAEAAAASKDETQFGKPLSVGASSLTQKLHGPTLGSSKRKCGHGVGSAEPPVADANPAGSLDESAPQKRKILYAGMAPGSKQLKSGVSAAAGVHKMVIETPSLYTKSAKPSKAQAKTPETTTSSFMKATKSSSQQKGSGIKAAVMQSDPSKCSSTTALKTKKWHEDNSLPEEEQKKLLKMTKRKKRRKLAQKRERKRQLHILRQQQSAQVAHARPKAASGKKGKMAAKGQGKKKGPRTVEYICALCSEVYNSTCDCNPWWALTHHECPKCRKAQVPRLDISAPANAIEYHPALLVQAEEGGNGGGGAATGPGVMHINPSHIPSSATFPMNRMYPALPSDSDSGSDLSDISDGDLSDDSLDSDFEELESIGALSPAEQAENEIFGAEYTGPKLTDDEHARLLVLMSHASTCPGRHKHAKHRDICGSVKYLMLHVRDCPGTTAGTTATFDVCPFPWCRKVKHSLYHMVSCPRPKDCPICSPKELSPNLSALVGLNDYRRKKHRERRAAAIAAAAAAAKQKPPPRAMTKSNTGAPPKTTYRPAIIKSGVVKPATTLTKGASHVPKSTARTIADSSVPPPRVAAAASSASAVATAAAAAKAAVFAATATKSSTAQTKPCPKLVSNPVSAKSSATSTQLPSTAATSVATNKHPSAAAASSKVAVNGSTPSGGRTAAVNSSTASPRKSPAAAVSSPTKPVLASPQPPVASSSVKGSAPRKEVHSGEEVAAASVPKESPVVAAQSGATAPRVTVGGAEDEEHGIVDSEKGSAETHAESDLKATVKVEDVVYEKESQVGSEPATPSAKGSHSLLRKSAPVLAKPVEGNLNASVKEEHAPDEEHDEEKCSEECCQETRAAVSGDVKASASGAVTELLDRNALEGKSQSSDSAELSRSSSCSDEVQKKEGVVRISSC